MVRSLAEPMGRRLLVAHNLSTERITMTAERGVKSEYTRDFFVRKRPREKTPACRPSQQNVIWFAERSEGPWPRKENQPCERVRASWTASMWQGMANIQRAYPAYFAMIPPSKISEKSWANNARRIVAAPRRRLSRYVRRKLRNVHPRHR